jgi:hypothetical protein
MKEMVDFADSASLARMWMPYMRFLDKLVFQLQIVGVGMRQTA